MVLILIKGGAVMKDRIQCWNATTIIWIAAAGLLTTTWLPGCEQRQPDADVKKEPPVASATLESATGEAKPDVSVAVTNTALTAPVASPGRTANDEGVSHAREGHWDIAEGHFRNALETDPKLAEAQFNLGLALNSLGKHDEAKAAFMKAAEMAPNDIRITESEILKKHTST
jgi:Flp pilus assembly protein TadD